MSKHYVEKALLATNSKIERLKEQSFYVIKNQNKIIIIIALFSFGAPYIGTKDGKSIMEWLEVSYAEVVVFTFVIIISSCLLGHVIWTTQDGARMRRLLAKKEQLEAQLKSYD